MAQRIGWVFVIALIALMSFIVYRNVLADDSAVRAMAETLLPLAIHTTARAVATPDPAPRIVEWARAAAMPL